MEVLCLREVVCFKGEPVRRQETLDISRIRVQFFDKDVYGNRREIVVTPREWILFSSKHFYRRSGRNTGVTLYEGA